MHIFSAGHFGGYGITSRWRSSSIILSLSVSFLCGMSPTGIIVGLNEVSDISVKNVLEKMRITLRVLN